MSNDLVTWDDNKLQEIKKLYAPTFSNDEFQIFCQIGKSTGLNPFLRELWAVKYKDGPASIFVGRDGYRKSAQASPLYDWHSSEDIRENDTFSIKDGQIIHDMDMKDRGKLVGAYALAQRKGSSRPNYARVDLSEYNTGRSVWSTKPSTMIKKVAEAQVLRMTFQDLFAGTYDESEQWEEKEEVKVQPKTQQKTTPRKVIDMTPEEEEKEEEKEAEEVKVESVIEIDRDAVYEKYILALDAVKTTEELSTVFSDIKKDRDSLGKVYVEDLVDRVKSMKTDLESTPKTETKSTVETEPKKETEQKTETTPKKEEDVVSPKSEEARVDYFDQYIAEIKATKTTEELNAVMVQIDSALASSQITLNHHGVLQSHKGIQSKKIPK